MWVFTDKRARILLAVAQPPGEGEYIECRVPKEMLWVNNRYRQGVFVLDVDAEAVWNPRLHSAFTREGHDEDGDLHYYQPRTLKQVTTRRPSSS